MILTHLFLKHSGQQPGFTERCKSTELDLPYLEGSMCGGVRKVRREDLASDQIFWWLYFPRVFYYFCKQLVPPE